ncbi:39S ribosomal protein L12, mitochondrial [Nilaparvata lugens]|uniref:39S ribosomal protein L12, mitochondrial n=1 Tax=Nilaparvata lugens TaxID=108931 RepID=UPI000B97F3E8|nr:39S ribosomal protein L12, mitochondrial [Nilaparvata lugens]
MLCSRQVFKAAFNQRRSIMKCCSLLQSETLNIPPSDGPNPVFSPKIEGIVSEISKLTLLEVSELSTALKKKLNLPDAPMFAAGPVAAAAAPVEEDEAPVKVVQTSFKVKLMKFDEKQKVALIKEVKSQLDGMNLVQAKKFVEGAPILIKDDITKEEAEKFKAAFEKVGGECEIS